jgi:hypothetical protein
MTFVPLSIRTPFGTPSIAKSTANVSTMSSLVKLRAQFKAKHSRIRSSTIDSHQRFGENKRLVSEAEECDWPS